MDPLELAYEAGAEPPKEYRELYTEADDGSFALDFSRFRGIKRPSEFEAMEGAKRQEIEKRRQAVDRAAALEKKWGQLDYDDVMSQLDSIPALKAAAEGKFDKAEMDREVQRLVAANLTSETAPLKRELATAVEDLETANSTIAELREWKASRELKDVLQPLLVKKVVPEHFEDVMLYAQAELHKPEGSDKYVVREGVEGTAGLSVDMWLEDKLRVKPGWLPASKGAGLTGSSGNMGVAENPWSHDDWNVTKQGKYLREHGPEKAKKLAQMAGTDVGGLRPSKA